jgi:hypothetical protein
MSLNLIGAFGIGSTLVGDDIDSNVVDAGGGVSHGETRVAGSLSLANSPQATVSTRTTVTATRIGIASALPTPSTIAARTTVAADMTRTTLRGGTVATRTTVAAALVLKFTFIHTGGAGTAGVVTLALRTTVAARLNFSPELMTGLILPTTTVTANLIKPKFLVGSTATCGTTVAGAVTVHLLRGTIPTRTTVVGQAVNKGRFAGAIATRTTTTARLGVRYEVAATLSARTTVSARMHSYPTDFQDVFIRMRTDVAGQIGLKARLSAAITAKTVVTALLTNRVSLITGGMSMRTTVTGRARYTFGADLILRTLTHGRLGIRTGINSWSGRTIAGKTVVTGTAPSNGFVGTAVGRTRLTVILTRATAAQGTANCATQFHTHFNGRFAHEGPFGSVNLTSVPHGDLGIPDDITCSTAPTADITVERQRMLVVFGNAGLSVDRSLVAHGNATAGTGIRQVGSPVDLPEKVSRQVAYYV